MNTLETIPAHINGQLLACVGDRISLICSCNAELSTCTEYTRWTVNSPTIACDSVIDHLYPASIEHCGPFVFQNVTEITNSQPITNLSSTIVATANVSMSGTVIQCSTSQIKELMIQTGPNITLCIPGKRYTFACTYSIHAQQVSSHLLKISKCC